MSHQFKLDWHASGCGADPQSAIVPMHWPSWLRGPATTCRQTGRWRSRSRSPP